MSYQNRVLPELLEILNKAPKIDLNEDIVSIRKMEPPAADRSPEVKITTRNIQGPESELLLRIYEPADRNGTILPAVYWMHGGGYILGSPEGDDGFCEYMVNECQCVVISVDYRLAPEHPFPAAIEDCYAGLQWVFAHAEECQIDLSRIAIAGASAGGGLTAALSLLARDRGGLQIAFQMPLYPMLDDRNETSSSYEINEENMPKAWNRESNLKAWELYLGPDAAAVTSPYAAPGRAEDLTGLPPAYTFIGQLDPFRDETITYVARLAQAGVSVEFHLYPGCFHGFDAIFNDTEVSRQARSGCIEVLRKAFKQSNKE
ncbi:alpha/beta hydrolase [Paenibacillus sp. FSL R7-0345]|uniref:alpha/beta hydrolase n=1 Tax=Paenibacillus sp. FSL R7-0345 TaxID=2954535 RepID=UPI00315ABD3F